MDGWVGGWVGGWKDGWIDGWVFMRKNTEMFRLSQLTTTNLSSTADQNCYFFRIFTIIGLPVRIIHFYVFFSGLG